MRNAFVVSAVVTAALMFAAQPAVVAHHSAATFDTTTEITFKGTVTRWHWFNPHCLLEFDGAQENGDVRHWTAETSNPADMTLRGWARTSFTPGDAVTITVQPARNGSPVGRIMSVVLASGKVLK